MAKRTSDGPEEAFPDEPLSRGLAWETAGGIVGGTIGSLTAAALLYVADILFVTEPSIFTRFAAFLDIPGGTFVGALLFIAVGALVWPPFFSAIGEFVPGSTYQRRGIAFSLVLWTGLSSFLVYSFSGLVLLGYLLIALVAHVLYGFKVGSYFAMFSRRDGQLV